MGLWQYDFKGSLRLVVETIFMFLDFVVVGLRFWARRLKRKSLEFNDYAIAVALVSSD